MRNKEEELRAQRIQLEAEKNQTIERMQDMLRKHELHNTERMNIIVNRYEKQIQILKDQLLREHKSNDDNVKRLTDELARTHKMEMDQVEAKNRAKLRQLNDMHAQELRSLTKRNEERMDQVIGELKKS